MVLINQNKDNSKEATTALEKLQTKSQSIMGVFTKAVSDMEQVNSDIDEQIEVVEVERERLNTVHSDLSSAKNENVKFINNIKGLLG